MKSIIPPPLKFLSGLNGFAKPEIRNCSMGNVSFFLSLTIRGHLFPLLLKKSAFQIYFRFGFSSLTFRKVSVALLLLLFSQLLSFVSGKEKFDFSDCFLPQ